MFSIGLLYFLEILSCWADSNLGVIFLIYKKWTPHIMGAERMKTLYWMTQMNNEWNLWGDMSSSFDDNVEVEKGRTWSCLYSYFAESSELDGGSTWAWFYSVFTWYAVSGGRQSDIKYETFLEVTAARWWVDGACYQRGLSGVWFRPFHWWYLYFPLLSCLPLCVQWWY